VESTFDHTSFIISEFTINRLLSHHSSYLPPMSHHHPPQTNIHVRDNSVIGGDQSIANCTIHSSRLDQILVFCVTLVVLAVAVLILNLASYKHPSSPPSNAIEKCFPRPANQPPSKSKMTRTFTRPRCRPDTPISIKPQTCPSCQQTRCPNCKTKKVVK